MSMIIILLGLLALVILGGLAALAVSLTDAGEGKPKYAYTAKKHFLTKAETEFYNALGQAVSHEYRIFAQVSLGSILDEKVQGQDWRAARAHINRKSVDFLLCDKESLSPKLAIELDDKTHEREDRHERDVEVERILKASGIPLLRVQNHGQFEPSEVERGVRSALQI